MMRYFQGCVIPASAMLAGFAPDAGLAQGASR